jgi:DNA-binding NtrC family response regulator
MLWFRRKRSLILLVDNVESYRESLKTALELEGYRVQAVGTRRNALKEFEKERPDLALVDIRLIEEEDQFDRAGVRLTRELVDLKVPVIVITAHTTVAPIVEVLKEPQRPKDVLHKTQDGRDKIIESVARALRESKTQKATGRRTLLVLASFVAIVAVVGWLIHEFLGQDLLLSYGISLAAGLAILILDIVRK